MSRPAPTACLHQDFSQETVLHFIDALLSLRYLTRPYGFKTPNQHDSTKLLKLAQQVQITSPRQLLHSTLGNRGHNYVSANN